jgi:hypothetical protein
MKIKSVFSIVSLLLLSVSLCSVSFAIDIPDGVTHDEALSVQALDMAKQQFTMLKQQLTAMAQTLPPDQKAMVENAIAIIDGKLTRLERIDVYFADEASAGEAYDRIYDFYMDKLEGIQDIGPEEIQFAIANDPGMIPDKIKDSLDALLEPNSGYEVKGITGTSGKSRLSLLSVYIYPQPSDPQTFELKKGTTLVIATDR